MFGIDFEELIVLLVLALILFGPDKLPEYGAKLGRLVAKIRQAGSEVTQQFHSQVYQPPPSVTVPTCPHCAQKLGPDFVFCPKCGQSVKETPGPEHPLAS